jgi:vanillate O-demethylase ferredoxin subunit
MAKSIEAEMAPEFLRSLGPNRLLVRVRSITYQGDELNEYELVPADGGKLSSFTPGSHVDIYFRDGRVRQYSLCGDDLSTESYRIVIQREKEGRGGSRDIFERVHVGRYLVISKPRNNFNLEAAERYVLIAGGIGITPVISMARQLVRTGKPFTLHYCTRAKERTAFLSEIKDLCPPSSLHLYHDGGDPRRGVDLDAVLTPTQQGTHLYYCGPSGLMRAIAEKSAHWPAGHAHAEYFDPLAAPLQRANDRPGQGFEVVLASTQQCFHVPEGKSILEVLRSNGWDVPSSCEAGLCGTCRVRYIDGVPDHRDLVLQEEEKARELLVCCSRSLTEKLTLDL